MTEITKKTGLELLREPFPKHLISKLPKPTKAQTDEVKTNYKAGIRCSECGAWHHPNVVHLDFVGHAALTDRLLDCDPEWNWEPVSVDESGMPKTDKDGGMWIRLTVCGVTRLGYGDAENKTGPSATKERIGDALRNAAMRFGAALDLWSKADLHADEHVDTPKQNKQSDEESKKTKDAILASWLASLDKANSKESLDKIWNSIPTHLTTERILLSKASQLSKKFKAE